jgi:nucleoside-diphosphate-sugar epimerase
MKYEKILVSGGAGFIGSHIVNRLIADGAEVTVYDNLSTGKLDNLSDVESKDRLHFIKGDICNFDSVKAALKGVDAVFHEAAFVSVNLSVENPLLANEINVNGTLNMLKAAVDMGVKRFVFASSAAVYGDDLPPEKREDMMLEPSNPYGITKLAGESYVKAFYKVYGLETVALRYFNVYGPKQCFDLGCAYGGAITIFLNRILRDLPPVIYGDGEQTRDFVSVHDIVDANMLALNSKNGVGQAFNIGSGDRVTVNQVAQAIKQSLGKTYLENVYQPARVGEVKHGYADITKAQTFLAFAPKYNFDDGITKLIQWYNQNNPPRIVPKATSYQR